MNDPAPVDVPAPIKPAPASHTHVTSAVLSAIALLIALVGLALLAWQWLDTRNTLDALRGEVAKKLSETETLNKQNHMIAEQARDASTDAQVKIGVLENRLAESQNQQIALEALYQELSRNRDEWAYAEIEQSFLIASQQLQLAGNVKAALIALQN